MGARAEEEEREVGEEVEVVEAVDEDVVVVVLTEEVRELKP